VIITSRAGARKLLGLKCGERASNMVRRKGGTLPGQVGAETGKGYPPPEGAVWARGISILARTQNLPWERDLILTRRKKPVVGQGGARRDTYS